MLSKEELYDLYIIQKMPIKDIIKKYDIPNATLYRLLKQHGINVNRSAEISKEELYDLYITQNLPLWKIGEMFNCDRKAVARLCKKYNIEKVYITEDDVINAFNNSKSYVEMAEKLNTTPNTCSKYCKKYGVKYDYLVKDKYYSNETYNSIKELSENKKLSIREIEKELNIPRKYISDIIKSNNIYSISFNGLNTYTRNIDNHILEILNNKEGLINYIKENNIVSANHLSRKLNISCTMACHKCSEYGIYDMFPKQSSSEENYISDYIDNYFNVIKNNRTILNGKEIDIYIPELKIGIEFNGDYWHNEKFVYSKYHQEKSLLAEDKGIFLYHIFEYEWNTKQDQIINQLHNILGINENKIYARKCIIKEVNNGSAKDFLLKNHLQGDDKSSIKLGLYYENELVSLMTFVKPRFNKNYEWELSRFCSKANCNVVGGASKLFNYFINGYNPKSIISYSNIAHTRGNLYHTLGMTLAEISKPNYVWCNNNSVLTRYQCQKHKLLEQGYKGISEVDIMHNRGYYRIYDCGNKVWVWKKEKL